MADLSSMLGVCKVYNVRRHGVIDANSNKGSVLWKFGINSSELIIQARDVTLRRERVLSFTRSTKVISKRKPLKDLVRAIHHNVYQ